MSDYEAGMASNAIEWVARGSKPIAEVSCRRLTESQLEALRGELREILEKNREPGVKAYILELADLQMYAWGFYSVIVRFWTRHPG